MLFDLIYRFGLRRREAALIELDDISLENETIWIRRLKRGISAEYRLHPRTLALLRSYLPLRDWGASRFVFQSPQPRGQALSASFIYQRFRAYATAADLPENRRHVHDFRHSIAVHFMVVPRKRGASAAIKDTCRVLLSQTEYERSMDSCRAVLSPDVEV